MGDDLWALDSLRDRDRGKTYRVWGFDHYLSRSFSFLKGSERYLEKIGKLVNIECRILEPIGIPRHRARTLEQGLIWDFLPHALSIIEALLNRFTTPLGFDDNWTHRLLQVKVANYPLSPVKPGTFALIKYGAVRTEEAYFVPDNDISGKQIPVTILLGKGVNIKHDKVIILTGSRGKIIVPLSDGSKFFFQSLKGGREELGVLDKNPIRTFLEASLDKKEKPLKTPGVLSFDAALLIVAMLHDVRNSIPWLLPTYKVGDSLEKVMDKIEKQGPPRLPTYRFADTAEQILQEIDKAFRNHSKGA